jgi:hypothetical protein
MLPVRARCAEALGKVVAANAKTLDTDTLQALLAAVLKSLPSTTDIPPGSEQELFTNLSLTAVMRMRQAGSLPALLRWLASPNPAVRFHAAKRLRKLPCGLASFGLCRKHANRGASSQCYWTGCARTCPATPKWRPTSAQRGTGCPSF